VVLLQLSLANLDSIAASSPVVLSAITESVAATIVAGTYGGISASSSIAIRALNVTLFAAAAVPRLLQTSATTVIVVVSCGVTSSQAATFLAADTAQRASSFGAELTLRLRASAGAPALVGVTVVLLLSDTAVAGAGFGGGAVAASSAGKAPLSIGAISGIASGCVALIALTAIVAVAVLRRRGHATSLAEASRELDAAAEAEAASAAKQAAAVSEREIAVELDDEPENESAVAAAAAAKSAAERRHSISSLGHTPRALQLPQRSRQTSISGLTAEAAAAASAAFAEAVDPGTNPPVDSGEHKAASTLQSEPAPEAEATEAPLSGFVSRDTAASAAAIDVGDARSSEEEVAAE
jgi:hypothetical protein